MNTHIKKKILITGSNGFIGNELVNFLYKRNYDLIGSTRENLNKKNTVRLDLANLDFDLSKILSGCDTVIHLAARTHILKENSSNPIEEFRKINVDGTLRLANQAAKCNVRRFIFLSSIGVNGYHTNSKPFIHNDLPNPHNSYAISKFEAEEGLKKIAEKSSMDFVIIRSPAVYGKSCPGNFGKIENIIRKGFPLPFDKINNQRSLLSIKNITNLIYVCMNKDIAKNKIFLASDDKNLSLSQIITLLSILNKKKTRIFKVNLFFLKFILKFYLNKKTIESLLGDLEIDISYTKETLNWKPPFDPEKFIIENL